MNNGPDQCSTGGGIPTQRYSLSPHLSVLSKKVPLTSLWHHQGCFLKVCAWPPRDTQSRSLPGCTWFCRCHLLVSVFILTCQWLVLIVWHKAPTLDLYNDNNSFNLYSAFQGPKVAYLLLIADMDKYQHMGSQHDNRIKLRPACQSMSHM